MSNISAEKVKALRDKTGAGMMDCKKALTESSGDIEKALLYLRKKGIDIAKKKLGRTTSEGLIAVKAGNSKAVILEINSETDFVARNEKFQKFVLSFSEQLLTSEGDKEKALSENYPDLGKGYKDSFPVLISTIGENINFNRFNYLENENGFIEHYIHNQYGEGIGKIGVILSVKTDLKLDQIQTILKKLCMHIAATSPLSIDKEALDEKLVNQEREVLLEQVGSMGKPKEVLDKIINGKLEKYFKDVVLLEQRWVHDDKISVKEAIKSFISLTRGNLEIEAFFRYQLGE